MLLPMSPRDSMFLLAESANRPMHVGGLAVFDPPDGGDPDELPRLFAAAVERGAAAPLFRKRARRSLTSLGQWGWEQATEVDLDYHVRRTAVPAPGGMDELMVQVSWLHATPLDRSRPLWELHLIEGLADGRHAVYVKMHHALADGVSAMRLLHRALTTDPSRRDMPTPWEPAQAHAPAGDAGTGSGDATSWQAPDLLVLSGAAVRMARDVAGEVAGLVPALAETVDRAVNHRGGALTLAAPESVFNVPVGSARRFAAGSWPLERLRLVAKHADATINDVVMAMCAGALRRYLDEHDALPEQSLVAMVPVSMRADPAGGDTGNKIGSLSCDLATDLADPAERLAGVRDQMREGKAAMAGRSGVQVLAMSALGAAPLALGMLVGTRGPVRAPNVMISNVPGPRDELYWNGHRLDALYPLSIPVDGQALNITCTSNGDQISFGLTACRDAVPHIHTLPAHLDDELGDLERAVGL
ncbi:wax ester/triacylglycerol synthase family O-acyltransferase [Rhodococcus sp. D2-41]|uniref:WS/DGAT/MGAT family O-acyltransferase n=1 Tax=Speluncibacter jeojiensis TaxID=2710754 RepID=UPI00240F1EC5|nr:wax ester/triacylglycerol synthase family O-acyltransferase [Rhodococcus sp. D2-41]MDG3011118.1 wax ester/triacylglycerol synthase family O-acyltransferase [Rhodococcus sp. D2-41]